MRHYRHKNYVRWKVDTFLNMLPFLLQIALLLFFTGMPIFLWSVDPAVAGFVTALIIAWFFCWVSTVTFPALFGGCPYKSAEASAFFVLTWHIKTIFQQIRRQSGSSAPLPKTWREEETDTVRDDFGQLGMGLLKQARDVLFDKLVLANAARAYAQENEPRTWTWALELMRRDMVAFVWEQLVPVCKVNEDDLWHWTPDNSRLTCAWMKVCVAIKAVARNIESLENYQLGIIRNSLVHRILCLLVSYLYHRRNDAPDQQVIQDIQNLLYKHHRPTFTARVYGDEKPQGLKIGKSWDIYHMVDFEIFSAYTVSSNSSLWERPYLRDVDDVVPYICAFALAVFSEDAAASPGDRQRNNGNTSRLRTLFRDLAPIIELLGFQTIAGLCENDNPQWWALEILQDERLHNHPCLKALLTDSAAQILGVHNETIPRVFSSSDATEKDWFVLSITPTATSSCARSIATGSFQSPDKLKSVFLFSQHVYLFMSLPPLRISAR